MDSVPDVSSCANSTCSQQFRRLGEGKLYAFTVDEPERWGLPAHLKQKVVWLCGACSPSLYVRLDRRRYKVRVVHRHAGGISDAA